MSSMRRPFVLLTAAAITSTAAVAVPALAATKSVKVGDNYYVKTAGVPTVTVKKGDTVKWNFAGKKPHNVKVKSGPVKFSSKTMDDGSYSKKMTRAGLYTIFCSVHGQSDQSMKLRVTSK
jgi:plastocyanin